MLEAPLARHVSDHTEAAASRCCWRPTSPRATPCTSPGVSSTSAAAQERLSLHLTVGILAVTAHDVARRLLDRAVDDVAFRQDLPPGYAFDPDLARKAVAGVVQQLVGWLDHLGEPDTAAVADELCGVRHQPGAPPGRPAPRARRPRRPRRHHGRPTPDGHAVHRRPPRPRTGGADGDPGRPAARPARRPRLRPCDCCSTVAPTPWASSPTCWTVRAASCWCGGWCVRPSWSPPGRPTASAGGAPVAEPLAHRCALESAARDELLAGSASALRRWLVVEQPGAWGARRPERQPPGSPTSVALADTARAAGVRVCWRGEPGWGRGAATSGGSSWPTPGLRLAGCGRSTCRWRTRPPCWRSTWGRSPVTSRPASASRRRPPWCSCTHGRHDPCCADQGRPIVRRFAALGVADVGSARMSAATASQETSCSCPRASTWGASTRRRPGVVADLRRGCSTWPGTGAAASTRRWCRWPEVHARAELDERRLDGVTVIAAESRLRDEATVHVAQHGRPHARSGHPRAGRARAAHMPGAPPSPPWRYAAHNDPGAVTDRDRPRKPPRAWRRRGSGERPDRRSDSGGPAGGPPPPPGCRTLRPTGHRPPPRPRP